MTAQKLKRSALQLNHFETENRSENCRTEKAMHMNEIVAPT